MGTAINVIQEWRRRTGFLGPCLSAGQVLRDVYGEGSQNAIFSSASEKHTGKDANGCQGDAVQCLSTTELERDGQCLLDGRTTET